MPRRERRREEEDWKVRCVCGYVREKGEMAECIACKREGESSRNATFKREEERKTRKIFLRIIYIRTRVDKKKWMYIFICVYSVRGTNSVAN